MLWAVPPPATLWKQAVHNLEWHHFRSPSARALRILRLQNLYTVGQLADATFAGALHAYPDWLQEEVHTLFRQLDPVLTGLIGAQREREVRLAQIDWKPTVIGRPLKREEMKSLCDIDLRLLRCPGPVRQVAWSLGAADALDAAVLHREQVLDAKTSGPRRLEALRAAIAGALQGDRDTDDQAQVPKYLSASHTVAGRSLSLAEVGRLSQQAAGEVVLAARATRAIQVLEIETCFDLAAVLDREVTFRTGFGNATFEALRRVIAAYLDPLPTPCAFGASGWRGGP